MRAWLIGAEGRIVRGGVTPSIPETALGLTPAVGLAGRLGRTGGDPMAVPREGVSRFSAATLESRATGSALRRTCQVGGRDHCLALVTLQGALTPLQFAV